MATITINSVVEVNGGTRTSRTQFDKRYWDGLARWGKARLIAQTIRGDVRFLDEGKPIKIFLT